MAKPQPQNFGATVAKTQPHQNYGTLHCPICGKNKRNGKASCCATGGSWVGKCGNPGDTRFQYTWDDGARLCEGKSA